MPTKIKITRTKETYLGDGLYASRDRWGAITLRAPRGGEDHFVVLDQRVIAAFDRWRDEPES